MSKSLRSSTDDWQGGESAESAKMVQNLKEVCNLPEEEIYDVLRECKMDVNEAASRLLSQDSFWQVQRRRKHKKEIKSFQSNYITDVKSCGASSSLNHGDENEADQHADTGASAPSNDYEPQLHEKAPCNKESESREPPLLSNDIPADHEGPLLQTVPGQVSMADNARMGGQHDESSNVRTASNLNCEDPPVIEIINHHSNEEVEATDGNTVESSERNDMGFVDVSGGAADKEAGSLMPSITRKLQGLNEEDHGDRVRSEGNAPFLIIPDHLEMQPENSSNLKFGSFEPGTRTSYSLKTTTSVPKPTETKSEGTHGDADISSVGEHDTRDAYDGTLLQEFDAGVWRYVAFSAPEPTQQEEWKPENAEVSHANLLHTYLLLSSARKYTFDDAQRFAADFNQTSSQSHDDAQRFAADFNQTGSQSQNPATMSTAVQHSNLQPSTLQTSHSCQSNLQRSTFPQNAVHQSDPQHSTFPIDQSSSTTYGNDAMRIARLPPTESTPQALPGTYVRQEPNQPGRLSQRPLSQSFPVTDSSANSIGSLFLPRSNSYTPSSIQQSFTPNNLAYRSLASASLYRRNTSPDGLPGASINPRTAHYRPGTSINPRAAHYRTRLGNDDASSSLHDWVSLQQGDNSATRLDRPNSSTRRDSPMHTQHHRFREALRHASPRVGSLGSSRELPINNSAAWPDGHDSRTMLVAPDSTRHDYSMQNQQLHGLREAQSHRCPRDRPCQYCRNIQ